MNLNTANANNTAHATVRTADISLLCPHCGQFMLQLSPDVRPIQEKKHACPACSKQTRMAKLKTRSGDTYQLYLRQVDPKARISVYRDKK